MNKSVDSIEKHLALTLAVNAILDSRFIACQASKIRMGEVIQTVLDELGVNSNKDVSIAVRELLTAKGIVKKRYRGRDFYVGIKRS